MTQLSAYPPHESAIDFCIPVPVSTILSILSAYSLGSCLSPVFVQNPDCLTVASWDLRAFLAQPVKIPTHGVYPYVSY